MKTLRAFLLVIGIALVSLTLPSCLDDDNSYSLGDIWIAVATVVPEGNNVYYLRLEAMARRHELSELSAEA